LAQRFPRSVEIFHLFQVSLEPIHEHLIEIVGCEILVENYTPWELGFFVGDFLNTFYHSKLSYIIFQGPSGNYFLLGKFDSETEEFSLC